jgi:hypothetical protein
MVLAQSEHVTRDRFSAGYVMAVSTAAAGNCFRPERLRRLGSSQCAGSKTSSLTRRRTWCVRPAPRGTHQCCTQKKAAGSQQPSFGKGCSNAANSFVPCARCCFEDSYHQDYVSSVKQNSCVHDQKGLGLGRRDCEISSVESASPEHKVLIISIVASVSNESPTLRL